MIDRLRRCRIDLTFRADLVGFTATLTRAMLPDEICSPTDPNRAQADGGDLRFSLDEAGDLPSQAPLIETFGYDSVHGAGDADVSIQVRVPFSAAADTPLWVWYGHAEPQTAEVPQAFDADTCLRARAPLYQDDVATRHGQVLSGYTVFPPTGFLAPLNALGKPCGVTGNTIVDGNTLAIANFNDGEIIECDLVTGLEVARIALSGVAGGAGQIQGIFWDPVAQEYGVVGATTGMVEFYARTGAILRSCAWGVTNAAAYDYGDFYWFRGGPGQLRRFSKAGVLLGTVTLQGAAAGINIEGIADWPGMGYLFVTQNNSTNVFVIDKATGAVVTQLRGVNDQEHPAFDPVRNHLYLNGDGRLHSGTQNGENIVYRFTVYGTPIAWTNPTTAYTITCDVAPTSLAATGEIVTWWPAIKPGQMYNGLQARPGGVVRTYLPNVTFVDSQPGKLVVGQTAHLTVVYDPIARTLTTFKDLEVLSQATNVSWAGGHDGRFTLNGRTDGSIKFLGLVDRFRVDCVARSAEERAATHANRTDPNFAIVGTPEDAIPPPPPPPPEPTVVSEFDMRVIATVRQSDGVVLSVTAERLEG